MMIESGKFSLSSSYSIIKMIFLLTFLCSSWNPLSFVESFSIITRSSSTDTLFVRLNNRPCNGKMKQQCLYAKPPPKSNFDLGDVLAMEQKLIEEENKRKIQNETYNNDDFKENEEDYDDDDNDDEVDNEMIQVYTVPEELHNQRIDAILSALEPEKSRSYCASLISNGKVSILRSIGNNHDDEEEQEDNTLIVQQKSLKLEKDTIIQVNHNDNDKKKPKDIRPQNIPLTILFEDEHMIVLNKAAGMVVHPAAGNWEGTVVNALAHYLTNESPFGPGDILTSATTSTTGSVEELDAVGEALFFRPGIVHRLDKGTTGALLVAKTQQALTYLSEQFASRQVKKTYLAISVGNPGERVMIDKPIGRHPLYRQKMRVVPEPTTNPNHYFRRTRIAGMKKGASRTKKQNRKITTSTTTNTTSSKGRRALSYVDTLAFDGKLSLVKVRIETGRTHQIRVHLQDRHTPIYGDDIYGLPDWNKKLKIKSKIQRPLLHAYRLEITHPITNEPLVFIAPLPRDMTSIATTIWPDGPIERPDIFTASTDDNIN